MTGEEYIGVLTARRDAWEAEHPHDGPVWLRPLLEWFIRPGDEDAVTLPDRPARPATRPRTYRSAASLRAERDRVRSRLDALSRSTSDDSAVVNLSPAARQRAAASAGRRRMAALDRDITLGVRLTARLGRLDGRIARAEARERREATWLDERAARVGEGGPAGGR